jgi:hypothetical protein
MYYSEQLAPDQIVKDLGPRHGLDMVLNIVVVLVVIIKASLPKP